jgi:hypothetical protein
MKTLSKISPPSHHDEPSAIPGNSKLIAQWQRGLETTGGHTQWKLHLTLARSPSPGFTAVNHYQQP